MARALPSHGRGHWFRVQYRPPHIALTCTSCTYRPPVQFGGNDPGRLPAMNPRPTLRRIAAVGVLAAAAWWASIDAAAAHGVGGRLDLPVPLWQLAWAASFAVAASFVALGMFWNTPKFRTAAAGRILPEPFQQACKVQAAVVRALGLLALGVLLYAGLAGQHQPIGEHRAGRGLHRFLGGAPGRVGAGGRRVAAPQPVQHPRRRCGPAVGPPPRPVPSQRRPRRGQPMVGGGRDVRLRVVRTRLPRQHRHPGSRGVPGGLHGCLAGGSGRVRPGLAARR